MRQGMNILLANDDGIFAPGLLAAAKALSAQHKVTVVAPDSERSASGHAITMNSIIRCEKVNIDADCAAYSLSGTPADCVKFGLSELVAEPQLVVSGINRGANLGTDALYSGTVSAAMEGALLGFPALAVSLCSRERSFDFAAQVLADIAQRVPSMNIPKGTMLNINVPDTEPCAIPGEVFARLGIRRYDDHYECRQDPYGKKYYWLRGDPLSEALENSEGTDVELNKLGYITIVPMHFDLTDHSFLAYLNKGQAR